MYIVISLAIGLLIGYFLPYQIPAPYSIYAAVVLLAALDAAVGGINARMHHNFKARLFLSGALGNGLIAVFLTYMGERIGISLYLAAVVVFGTRLFQNFGEIRRELLTLPQKRNTINKGVDKTQEVGQDAPSDPI